MTDEELYRELLDILDNARCNLRDPSLRVRWGVRKRRLMDVLRERLEK